MMDEKPQLFVYGEGKTEVTIFSIIAPDKSIKLTSVDGTDKFNDCIIKDIKPEFTPGDPNRIVRVLIYSDLDRKQEERDIVRKFEKIAVKLTGCQYEKFEEHSVLKNVFILNSPSNNNRPGLLMVLHLAKPLISHGLKLINQTSDGYILSLALQNDIIQRFAEDIGMDSGNILNKVIKEVPKLLKNNNINLDQDKDYLGVFLAVTRFWMKKRSEDQQLLTKVILSRAKKYAESSYNEVMQSWQVALQEAQK